MSDKIVETENKILDDIRDIVTKGKSASAVLNLTNIVEEELPVNNNHHSVLKDISDTLDTLEDGKEAISNIKNVVKKLKASKNQSNYQQQNNTSLESLVISLLEPKIQQWIDANLAPIVKTAVEKEIKKIMHEDDNT